MGRVNLLTNFKSGAVYFQWTQIFSENSSKEVCISEDSPVEGNVLMCWSPLSLGMKDLWISGKAIGETQGQKNHGIFRIFRISVFLSSLAVQDGSIVGLSLTHSLTE